MIFGLIGYKGSGKTTVFEEMQRQMPSLREIQLAKKLKDVCAQVFGIPRWLMDDSKEKEKHLVKPRIIEDYHLLHLAAHYKLKSLSSEHIGTILHSPREVMAYVGSEILRGQDPDIHLTWAMRDKPKGSCYVVTDIRYPNELAFFNKPHNFTGIYVARRLAEEGQHEHMSEQHVADLKRKCHLILDNNGTKNDLYNQVANLLINFKPY